MCACDPESQFYPELHKKKRGQQVKGGDSPPLLHSWETPPGVLHPALSPQCQKDMDLLERALQGRAIQMSRELEHLSYAERLRALGLFSSRETLLQPFNT